MATTIKLKYGSGAPSASNLVQGEPALDLTNKRLYSENGSGAVVEIGSNPSSLSIGGAAVTSTPAELNYNDTGAAVGTVVASKTVTADSNKDVSSFRNITLTGELDAGSLDVSGNVDIDGVLETDALSLNGTTVTATAAQLNVLAGVTAFVDQDNMAANSATSIASQQSIKAYVDAQTGASSSTTATFANLDATTSLQVPDGATGARPGSPAVGNFRYNTTLNTFEGYSNAGWGEIGGGGANLTTNNFTGNGSTTGFTLGINPEVEQNTFVYIDGVYQQKNTYSTSGTTLTFSTAPPNGASVEVMSMTATTSIVGTVSDNAITTAKIANGNVTVAKMAANSVDSDQYVDGSIDTVHIADSQITVAKMAANSVDSDQYVDGSIDTVHIADSQITVAKMAANSVDSDQYVDGSIDTVHIADDQVTGAKLANNIDIAGTLDVTGLLTADAGVTVVGALTLGGTAVTSTAAELNILDGVTATATEINRLDGVASVIKTAGLETIYVPAAAMYPNTTDGSSDLEQVELSNGPELKCLDFAAAADDFAQFTVIFPKSWNEGTVTFQAFWTVTGTNTGTVAWGLSGISFADNASINTAFGTQVVATAKAFSGTSNDMTVSAVSGAVTISNAAVDTQTYFQVSRDVSADSQSGAARLLGIKLFFTTDAANDA
jgi:cytoskeletal protein CcmA (bactofilin family)